MFDNPPPKFAHISIPTKRSLPVLWDKALEEMFTKLDIDYTPFSDAIWEFNQSREILLTELEDYHKKLEEGIKYFQQLENLTRRIGDSQISMNLKFKWYDFADNEYTVQSSIAFEKANVLFNLAGIYCEIGNNTGSAIHFQNAASLISHIKDRFLHPPLEDIKSPILSLLMDTLLCQGQEIAFLKAIEDSKSTSICLKLGKCLIEQLKMIKEHFEKITRSNCKILVNFLCHKIDNCSFAMFIDSKFNYYQAILLSIDSKIDYDNGKIGIAIFKIESALKRIEQIPFSIFDGRFYNFLKHFKFELSNRYKLYDKENSLIYFQKLPNDLEESLDSSIVAPILKICNISKVLPESDLDLFKHLVPLQAHEKISDISEEKSKLLRYETMKCDSMDTEIQTGLVIRGFPSIMDEIRLFESSQDFELQNLEKKYGQILSNKQKLLKKLGQLFVQLEEIARLLDLDLSRFQQLKLVSKQNQNSTDDSKKYASFFSEIAEFHKRIHRLKNSYELDAFFCKEKFCINEYIQNEIDSVKLPKIERDLFLKSCSNHLEVIEKFSKERRALLGSLKKEIIEKEFDVNQIFSRSLNLNELIEKELKNYDDLCDKIDINIGLQKQEFETFCKEWDEFEKQTKFKNSTHKKLNFIDRTNNIFDSHCLSNIKYR